MTLPDKIEPNYKKSLIKGLIWTPIRYAGQLFVRMLEQNGINFNFSISQYHQINEIFMEEGVQNSTDNLSYGYADNGGEYQVGFDKRTRVLSLTPNIAPREALESLEEAIKLSKEGSISLILPPKQREITFHNVSKLEYIGNGELDSTNSGYMLRNKK